MFVAGIDAHATYSVIAIVSNTGELVHKPVRIKNSEADRLDELLEPFRPLEVVVETSPAWPWLQAESSRRPPGSMAPARILCLLLRQHFHISSAPEPSAPRRS